MCPYATSLNCITLLLSIDRLCTHVSVRVGNIQDGEEGVEQDEQKLWLLSTLFVADQTIKMDSTLFAESVSDDIVDSLNKCENFYARFCTKMVQRNNRQFFI